MTSSAKKLADGVPLCWECGSRFMYKKGGGFVFSTVRDRALVEHRVHVSCVEPAVRTGDGVKAVAA